MRTRHPNQERGIALLTVLIALMVITIMLFEFQYASMVEQKLAYNELTQLQTSYLAKAGARMGLLRIGLYARLRTSGELKNMTKGMNITPYLDKIWNLPLPPFPPPTGSVAKLAKPDKDAAEKQIEETHIKEGRITHVINNESSKINLNFLQTSVDPVSGQPVPLDLRSAPKTLQQYVARLLINLLDGFLKESDKPYDEYPNLRPEELVVDIIDWVSPGNNKMLGGAKDAPYERLKPPYKAKRNRLYTVEELRMVNGIDDHLFQKLKRFVTVYSEEGKINLNSASKNILRALYQDFTNEDLDRILEKRNELNGWPDEKTFVDYVTGFLGRSAFTSVYNDPANYPFTVSSQSFMIEATGALDRSKITIQKTIRVGVALTRAKAGRATTNGGTQAQCNANPSTTWDFRSNTCRGKPQTDSQCITDWLGGVEAGGSTGKQCKVLMPTPQPAFYIPLPAASGSPGSTPGTGGASGGEPNAMRILYWVES